MAGFDEKVIDVVRQHGPIKAVEIARKLSARLKTEVTRAEVNSVLYRNQGKLHKDGATNEWVTLTLPSAKKSDAPVITRSNPPRPSVSRSKRRVSPSPEQIRLIEFDSAGNMLIRGEAGSGKTTVLAARAEFLGTRTSSPGLFLTYNRALARYVNDISSDAGAHLIVRNFHAWTREVASQFGLRVRSWIQREERETILQSCLRALAIRWPEHRFIQMPMGFWHDEFEWIFGRGLRTAGEYVAIERTGRGQTIQVRREEDRPFVWALFEAYKAAVSLTGCWDVDDPGGLLRAAFENGGGQKLLFSHIFIDEVQDFDKSWLEAIALITTGPMTMAGDLAQRIYRRSFSWREVGIDLPGGRSQRLGASYRTTYQIMRVAQHLAINPDLRDNADYLAPSLPERHGMMVQRLIRATRAQVVAGLSQWVKARLEETSDGTVLIAVPSIRGHQEIVRELRSLGIEAGFAKGDDLADQLNQVQVTTYHQVKGLEWDHVVLMDLSDERMPGYFLAHLEDPEERLEAENRLRRLVYVALTRARNTALLAGEAPFCRYFRGVTAGDVQDI